MMQNNDSAGPSAFVVARFPYTAAHEPSDPNATGFPQAIAPRAWWQRWWSSQSSHRQDRFAMLAPLAAVLLFLAAIVAAFWYLRLEEVEREQEAVKRDLEYAQQRLRLRLLERQEQLMRLARDISNKEMDPEEFMARAEALVVQYPELQAITWIDASRRIIASQVTPSLAAGKWVAGEKLKPGDTETTFGLARDLQQPVYSQPAAARRPCRCCNCTRAPDGARALRRRDAG
jgi:hypothetical protein